MPFSVADPIHELWRLDPSRQLAVVTQKGYVFSEKRILEFLNQCGACVIHGRFGVVIRIPCVAEKQQQTSYGGRVTCTGCFCRRSQPVATTNPANWQYPLNRELRANMRLYAHVHFLLDSLAFKSGCGLSDPRDGSSSDAVFEVWFSTQRVRIVSVHRLWWCRFQQHRC